MSFVRVSRTALLALLVVVASAACSYRTTQASTPRRGAGRSTVTTQVAAPRPTQPVDRLVPVGGSGARLHLTCAGAGDTTVVLIAGFEAGEDNWGSIVPPLVGATRVCSYARFGTGASDEPPADQTFGSEARDLHELLALAGEPGPYVVVGHSFGGPEAVMFASRYADDVTGVALIDASPTDWPTEACGVPDDGSEIAQGFGETCARITDPTRNVERLDGTAAFAEVAEVASLGDVPLVVMTRADVAYAGLPQSVQDDLARTWHDGQAHWAGLSTAGEVVPVADTGHVIQLEQPAIVVERISALLGERG